MENAFEDFEDFIANKIRSLGISEFKLIPVESKPGAFNLQFYTNEDTNLFRISINIKDLYKEFFLPESKEEV